MNILLSLFTFTSILMDQRVLGESRTNFKLMSFKVTYINPSITFLVNITNERDKQYSDFDFSSPIALDEYIGAVVRIDTIVTKENSLNLFTVKENNMCTAANKYLGEFWYGLLRAAQITPGACPVPAGRYHGRHVYLDFQAITLQTFPFGKLKFNVSVINNRKPKSDLVKITAIVENIIN